ncbi:MAG TPA: bifunctional GNAT family N-acetyltransferase/(deoxy)nucleoside triphosphate pyrophosphohydrolase [Acetobacteraceae bacterium]|nr:bifunctional GNAT family N-acetyltransferase/(deoxy)nucleoside triphosphate pyrophosphohydrolase [Acetobacteraceae bacterium]
MPRQPRPATPSAEPKPGRTRGPRRAAAKAAEPPPRLHALAPEEAFAPLITERLILRPLLPHDAESLHRLVNDWEVTRNLAVVPFPYPRALADDWIASTARELAAGDAYNLAVTGRDGDQEILVGVVGLRLDAKARTAALGYWVGRRFWGHGVATEAAGRVVRWGFANLAIDRVLANVATDNPASAAVLRRIGFRQTGKGAEHSVASGGERPVWRFEAGRDDVFGVPGAASSEPGTRPMLLVAACALIDSDGRVLLARRPEGKTMAGLWEFPGGKLHPGETPEVALIRELKEELGIDVSAACLAPFAFASHAYERFHLLMPLYLCRRWKGLAMPRENQTLKWVRPDRLPDYDVPPADKPLIAMLRDFL